MKWPLLFAVACVFYVGPLAAQTSFVVPSQQLTRGGNSYDDTLTPQAANQPSHVQLIYDTKDIPTPIALLRQMEFRRTSFLGGRMTPNPAATWDITLVLSVNRYGLATVASTFAFNVGNLPMTVFSGRVNLPFDASTVNPPPFTAQIPFTALFPYLQAAGAGLVADFYVTGYFAPGRQDSWRFDSQVATVTTFTTNGRSDPRCRFGVNGNTGNTLVVNGTLLAGLPVSFGYLNLLPRAPGLIVIGNLGEGWTWGGLVLPIDLEPLGAPGCFLRASIDIAFVVQCDATGNATTPTFTLPPEVGSTGPYYIQGIFLDASANDLGLMTTASGSFTIGGGDLPRGARVSRLADTGMSPTGTVVRQAVIARFVQ